MVGVIRSWDILSHPIVTIRSFGWQIFFRAVFPWHDKTFLSLLEDAKFFEAPTSKVPALVRRCIALELQAKVIYAAFARAFAELRSASQFFEALAQQEKDHAELLELCRAAATCGHWEAQYFAPWQDYVPRLEQQMQEAEASLKSIGSLDDALRLVIQIESSEINQVFQGVIRAADSPFVRKLRAFQEAVETHIAYICPRISEFSPNLLLACRELRARFPRVK